MLRWQMQLPGFSHSAPGHSSVEYVMTDPTIYLLPFNYCVFDYVAC